MELAYILLIAFFIIAIAVIVIYYLITKGSSRSEEALEIKDRSRRGSMTPFSDRSDEMLASRQFVCPECGEGVGPRDEECPACGKKLVLGEFECNNCGKTVDPTYTECPYCGEILLPEPYVCPRCHSPVEFDATSCDACKSKFWSPILLDEASMKKRKAKYGGQPGEMKEGKKPSTAPRKVR